MKGVSSGRAAIAASSLMLAGLFVPMNAQATLGIFEHGAGIKAQGFGGVSYALGEETTTLSINPALATDLGRRYDIGVDTFWPTADARYRGNQAGPDARYLTDARRYFYIPQGGFSIPLSERITLGMTVFSAGLGPDYPNSPYARFGGAPRANLALGSSGIATAFGYRLSPGQSIGASFNLGYQTLKVNGLQFLSSTDPATRVSVAPDKTTNQGIDGSFSVGFSLGWKGQITPQLSAGIGYRSKSWTQKMSEYKGLLPGGGDLDLPPVFGAGLAYRPLPEWTLGLDVQRYDNESQKAFSNKLSQLAQGHAFGSPEGPGFGLRNQTVYKFGLAWQATPQLVLRAGYLRANQAVQSSETLFGFLGCVTPTTHYTLGTTYTSGPWEYSGFATYAPFKLVQGQNSIPASFGGGEADIGNHVYALGLSLGRHF